MKIKNVVFLITALLALTYTGLAQESKKPTADTYDAQLAKRLGADEYGMRNYVFVLLKNGPNESKIQGKERDDLFAGHLANIKRLAVEGKLVVAGPFGGNDRGYRGIFIINATTVEEAQKLVETDPAVKAGALMPEFTPLYCSASLVMINDLHK